jgi:ADP-dependent NAD(P)H-hydrate dehydratase / NAD(P)H-hydrate epimerase
MEKEQEAEIKLVPITPELIAKILPLREQRSNKETFGRMMFMAGSKGLTGAAMLSSKAAMRVGAGVSILAIPGSQARFVDTANPEVMTLDLPETKANTLSLKGYTVIKKVADKLKVLAIGPGITRRQNTKLLVKRILKNFPEKYPELKFVIDADGLAGLVKFKKELATEQLPIITPHAGELAGLLKIKRQLVEMNPPFFAKMAAKKYGVLVVLKGFQTIIVSPHEEEILFNYIGNAGMATAGTGDVLTGTIAGFLAQNLDSWKAAALGVFFHSLAGNIAAMDIGQDGIIASDILAKLPQAIKRIKGT